MLITPERIRWMKAEFFECRPQILVACDVALRAGPGGDLVAESACVELVDRWQATDVPIDDDRWHSLITREQLEDLSYYALCADDWHAVRICRAALRPAVMRWIPNARELEARDACARAWNARAERLRDAGLRSLGASLGSP